MGFMPPFFTGYFCGEVAGQAEAVEGVVVERERKGCCSGSFLHIQERMGYCKTYGCGVMCFGIAIGFPAFVGRYKGRSLTIV